MRDYNQIDPREYDARQDKSMAAVYLRRYWFPRFRDLMREYCVNRVLDLGCGTGEYTKIAGEYAKSVVGIDRSRVMVDYAKTKGGEYVLGDALAIPLRDKSVSTVVSVGLLEYADVQFVAREVSRVLRPSGIWLILTPNKYSLARLPYKCFCRLTHRKYRMREPSYWDMKRSLKQFNVVKVLAGDGLAWLPKTLDRSIGLAIYSLIQTLFIGHNPFSNIMVFVAEKT